VPKDFNAVAAKRFVLGRGAESFKDMSLPSLAYVLCIALAWFIIDLSKLF